MTDSPLVKNNPDIADRLSFAVVPFSRSAPSTAQIINLPNGTLAEVSDNEEGGIDNKFCEMPSAINIADSSDVVIGPVTQFHGPVTIMQNPRNQEIRTDAKTPVVVRSSPIQKKSLILTLAVVAAVIIIVIVMYAVPKAAEEEETVDVVNSTSDHGPDKLGPHRLIRKNVWGGRPPVFPLRPLKHPTDYVLISHTAGRFCKNISGCSIVMQDSQALHVTSFNSPDIGYNFLIGGDGNIYVGRGWDYINFHRNLCIAISFIGNYIFDELTEDMIAATKALLAEGVKLGKLSENYRVVSHNQTTPTISPGNNVYKVIKTWSHFKSGNVVF